MTAGELVNGKWQMEQSPQIRALYHLPLTICHRGRRFSAAWWPRQLLVGDRRVVDEPGEHRRVLLEILLTDALVGVDVRMMRADVVGDVVLDGIEAGDAGFTEA